MFRKLLADGGPGVIILSVRQCSETQGSLITSYVCPLYVLVTPFISIP